jgi:hypothetical protein
MFPFSRALTAVVIGLVLGLGATTLRAQEPGKPFSSPLKNFTVMVPEFPFGTKVQKQNNKEGGTVSFLGAAGHAWRIDYTRLPTGTTVPMDSTELQAFYHKALEDLLHANPSTLLSERAYTLDDAMMLLALVSFPAGSHLQNAASGKRMDSVRGLLIFAHAGFLYMLHAELAANVFNRPGEAPLAVEELSRRAEIFIPDFYRTIRFQ